MTDDLHPLALASLALIPQGRPYSDTPHHLQGPCEQDRYAGVTRKKGVRDICPYYAISLATHPYDFQIPTCVNFFLLL